MLPPPTFLSQKLNFGICRLQNGTNLLRAELKTAKCLQKPERGIALRSLKVDATSLRTRTQSHASTIEVSNVTITMFFCILSILPQTSAQVHSENRKKAFKEGSLSCTNLV